VIDAKLEELPPIVIPQLDPCTAQMRSEVRRLAHPVSLYARFVEAIVFLL
jgi:hypothetical protein